MSEEAFFTRPTEQSRAKSRIVAKYFRAWAKVVIPAAKLRENRIAYIDLFAGPGRYEDGTPSTPLIVLQEAIKDPELRKMLVVLFNDKNKENANSLQAALEALPGITELRYKPQVENEEVGQKIVEAFKQIKFVPTLLFIDPWGYKGLSLALIGSVLPNWGCDCVFFFNYNRINPGLNNDAVREHMEALFGAKRSEAIREKLGDLGPDDRESLVIQELSGALKEMGAAYVLPFTFKNEEGTRTKHHLIFATKSFRGYEIMKEIMAAESTNKDQGVASFEYSPASHKYPLLFALSRPLDDLEGILLTEYAGQSLEMHDIYESHSVGRPYIKANYKRVLTSMEAAGKIKTSPPPEKRRTGTFGDNVVVTFPGRAET
jgi:three-Cys-motif partner protein